jgi:hypothetical protein
VPRSGKSLSAENRTIVGKVAAEIMTLQKQDAQEGYEKGSKEIGVDLVRRAERIVANSRKYEN